MLRSPDGDSITTRPGGPPRRALLHVDGVIVDEVIVVDRVGGMEIHTHGSPAVLAALERKATISDSEPASPAERLLRGAMSREQLELALEQMLHDWPSFCRDLRGLEPDRRRELAAAAHERSRVALAHVVAQRVVLVGAQNAGKSSLFNRMLFRERVLTGPEPGLTRDPVAEQTVLDGYPYLLVDTAGEGPTTTPADLEAVHRGREERRDSLLVLVVDGATGPSAQDRALARTATAVIHNKSDLPPVTWPANIPCDAVLSCRADDPARIRDTLGRLLRLRRSLPPAGPVGGAAALSPGQLDELETASEERS
jgi:small GTP-binding protein